MAVWSTVSISAVEYSRFDADFYHPMYLRELELWRRVARRVDIKKLGRIIASPVRTGRTPKSRSIKPDEQCIHFIKTDTVREGSIDFNNSKLLPARVVSARDIISNDAVVMTIIGATPEIVGRVAIVRPDDPKCVTNQNVAVISTNEVCDPYFLTAYFQTKWGRDQIWRHSRRTEQVNLNCREVERVLVPNPARDVQQSIGNVVRNALLAADRGVEFHHKAQELLESELGLNELTFQRSVSHIARFSEVELTRRFDSEHFYPAFDNLREKLAGHLKFVRFGLLLKFCQRGKQPVYSEYGLPVLNSKHIMENKVVLEGNRCAKPGSLANLQIQYGDVLMNGTGRGTIGRAAPYLISEGQAIPDNHVTILRPRTLDPAYLSFFLNSLAGKLQVEKHQRGSSGQLELYPFDIKKFWVWDAPQSIQAEIRRLYEQSTEFAAASTKLLEQATARVEQLIEEAVQS